LRLGAVVAIALLGACAEDRNRGPVPGEDEPYPNLSTVPARPSPSTTAEERREIVRGLVTEREAARQTDEALRAATEKK
jgi:hypothetical protein